MPLRDAISLIVVPFMSPVSLNARRAAARMELLRASAVSLRRGVADGNAGDAVSGDAVSGDAVPGTVTARPAFCDECPCECAPTYTVPACLSASRKVASQTRACRSAQGDIDHELLTDLVPP